MPNLDNSVILEIVKSAPSAGYSYAGLSGLDDTRSHKSQLFVYYRYVLLDDGTPVEDVEWKNWYDPFRIPAELITVDQSIDLLSIAPIQGTKIYSKDGTEYLMPPMDFTAGGLLHILRSQDVDNRAVVFGAGSRVTSAALNAAIGQVFGSVQELTDRTTSLEGFNFEVPIGNGGGGGPLTPGDKVQIFVSGVDLDTWTINAGVIGYNEMEAEVASKIQQSVDASQAAAAAPVQTIVGSGDTTVTNNGNGAFTVSSTDSGGTADGDKGDVVVTSSGEDWQVKDDSHNHIIDNVDGLQAALDTKATPAEAAAAAPVQAIVQGANVTVTESPAGTFEIASTATSGADAELTSPLTITDPVGPDQFVGQTYTTGTDLELIIREMLVSYQYPSFSNPAPHGGSIEVGTPFTKSIITFNSFNTENSNLPATLKFRQNNTVLFTNGVTLASGTGTVAQSVAFNPVATGTYQIPSGTTMNYNIRIESTNTLGQTYSAQSNAYVKYRSFAFPSTSASAPFLGGITASTSKLTSTTDTTMVVSGASSGGNYSWIAFPRVYFSGTPAISVTDTSSGFAATYNYDTDQNYTNAQGVVVPMSLFRTPFVDSVADGTVMDVS